MHCISNGDMTLHFDQCTHFFCCMYVTSCDVFVCAQVGTLRFCGSTEFSGGLWAGVELDKPEGKNDGSVAGVQYFTCRIKHGKPYHPQVRKDTIMTSVIIDFMVLNRAGQVLVVSFFVRTEGHFQDMWN